MINSEGVRVEGIRMTVLSKEEAEAFYTTLDSLLVYGNLILDLFKDIDSVDRLEELESKDVLELSRRVFASPEIIDGFVERKPAALGESELELAGSWRHAIVGDFVLMRHLKRHSIFLHPSKPTVAYGVVGITSDLEDMMPSTPVMVRTILIPFRDRITYHGVISPFNVLLGPGIRRSMEDSYREARARFGIVTSLPFTGEESPGAREEHLKALLRTERTRELYRDEIRELISSDRGLLVLYHHTMGRVHARGHRRRLRDEGVAGGWYAVLEDVVVAGGLSREWVDRAVVELIPEEKRDLVHIYQVKPR